MVLAAEIVGKAKELGFDRCGIIPLGRLAPCETKLKERIERFPETKERYEKLSGYAFPKKKYPWAESAVVCSFWYGKYYIPENLRGRIGRYYLTDGRRMKASEGYQTSVAFERYLAGQGLRTACDREFGITSLRWAAQEAGLGIIRKNNFFYTEKGSYQHLEVFLIDLPLEYILTCRLRACPESCGLCLKACPTRALAEPYAMNRNACVSDLTTWNGWDLTKEPLSGQTGDWIYGCDACQDACPYNRQTMEGEKEYPGLKELSEKLSLIQIVEANYEYLEKVLQPVLWYIPAEKSWRYKTNALNAMLNHYRPEYHSVIRKACQDEKKPVRDMAKWVLKQLD